MGFSGKLREILAAGLGWRKFKDIKDGQPENAQHLFRLPFNDKQKANMNLLAVLARLSSMTMLSRIMGFLRDAIVARYFGAGAAMDAFVVAFRLPNLLRRIFAEGAFS